MSNAAAFFPFSSEEVCPPVSLHFHSSCCLIDVRCLQDGSKRSEKFFDLQLELYLNLFLLFADFSIYLSFSLQPWSSPLPFTLVHLLAFFIFIFPSPQQQLCSSLPLSLSDYCCLFICLLFLPQKPSGEKLSASFLPLSVTTLVSDCLILREASKRAREREKRGRAYSKSCKKRKKEKTSSFWC